MALNKFTRGCQSTEDYLCSNRPTNATNQLSAATSSVEKLKSNGVRKRRRVTYFYCWHWINNSWEFSRVCVCSLGLPKSQCTWSAWASGFISRAAGFTHKWHSVTVDKTWIFHCDPFSKLEFMQWKDVDPPATFTQICNSAVKSG